MKQRKFENRLAKLDLEPIIFKLVKDPDDGKPWTLKEADFAEIEYRKFITLYYLYKDTDKSLAPSKIVDKFWHQHQLDTEKYRMDCEILFANKGQKILATILRFLFERFRICISAEMVDHFPYFGMRGQEDAQNLAKSFEETKKLQAIHFE